MKRPGRGWCGGGRYGIATPNREKLKEKKKKIGEYRRV